MSLQQRKTRTFKSFVLRALVPRALLFAAGAAALVLAESIAVSPTANVSVVPAEDGPGVVPAWTLADAAAHPECTPSEQWPVGTPAEFVVVQNARDGVHRKIAFDLAWRLNHDDSAADDVWVLGVCG